MGNPYQSVFNVPDDFLILSFHVFNFLNECKVFELDGISFSIPYNKKIVVLKGKGIPRINKNIYNVLDISDIICHITRLTSS